MKKLLLSVATVIAVSSAWAVPGIIRSKSGDVKKGDVKWLNSSQSYELKSGNITVTLKKSEVESLEIAKPKNFDNLVKSVEGGAPGSAIDGLTKIVKEYTMLQWDNVASRYLVEAYLQMNNPQKAYSAARVVIEADKDSTPAYSGELAPAYWQTLLALGKKTELENCLRMAVKQGSRPLSAEALLMRGDMILKEGGESPEAHKRALIEAYLKVALMYNDVDCVAQRVKACEKSAVSYRLTVVSVFACERTDITDFKNCLSVIRLLPFRACLLTACKTDNEHSRYKSNCENSFCHSFHN
jgi:hypothetical protein